LTADLAFEPMLQMLWSHVERTPVLELKPPAELSSTEAKEFLEGVIRDRLETFYAARAPRNGASQSPDAAPSGITVVNLSELLELAVAPREYVLEPILRARETAMVWAWRGTGKTYTMLTAAYAVASGGRVLKWTAPKPRKVLYVDGEMPVEVSKERMATIVAGADKEPPADDYFRMILADQQADPLPDLATPEGQAAFEPYLKDTEVIFIDSLTTLAPSAKENDAESWLPIQQWALRLRREGRTVIFIHHAGKGGTQRGTSRREDVLDLSIHLQHPSDYSPEEGARFEVHFDKTRGLTGSAVRSFEAKLVVREGNAEWQIKDLGDVLVTRAAALFSEGMTVRDVAEELKVSKSSAQRLRAKATADGFINRSTL
jgi:putative DNA primase/helicase